MMCQACENGLHYLCGMQTWCECDCAGASEMWGPSPDDDMPHSDTCTCEHCAQIYPERLPESWSSDDEPTPTARPLYEDQRFIECDMCGTTVPKVFGEFCYNAETDMTSFTCNRCLEEEGDL